ncbi:hypothetical protein NDU88_003798 [Pleurodeles waltl]|uniref:Uncharacterized protein n=1 Tax=Pleurodeles waltl TaxID=8319 RepID=A0AAV7UF40_PLEWA|nr:hypothetical protein NDU88_003798 [Pleurodeles waltl]
MRPLTAGVPPSLPPVPRQAPSTRTWCSSTTPGAAARPPHTAARHHKPQPPPHSLSGPQGRPPFAAPILKHLPRHKRPGQPPNVAEMAPLLTGSAPEPPGLLHHQLVRRPGPRPPPPGPHRPHSFEPAGPKKYPEREGGRKQFRRPSTPLLAHARPDSSVKAPSHPEALPAATQPALATKLVCFASPLFHQRPAPNCQQVRHLEDRSARINSRLILPPSRTLQVGDHFAGRPSHAPSPTFKHT